MRGCFFSSGDSMMTSADMPVFSSTCSCTVWPSMTSLKATVPPSSVRIVNEYGIPLDEQLALLHLDCRP